MTSSRDIRARLLQACASHYERALERGGADGRFLRAGFLAAEGAITAAPLIEHTGMYVVSLRKALERARVALDPDLDDEDGWAAGAIRTIQNELAKIAATGPAATDE